MLSEYVTNLKLKKNKNKQYNYQHENLYYPFIVIISIFHKQPIKYITITICCNIYIINASKRLLNMLKITNKIIS